MSTPRKKAPGTIRTVNVKWNYSATVNGTHKVLCRRHLEFQIGQHGMGKVDPGRFTAKTCEMCSGDRW